MSQLYSLILKRKAFILTDPFVIARAFFGRLDRVENFPASQVTCPAFGGESYSTIFVTTASQGLNDGDLKVEPLAGKVFHFESEAVGLAEYQVVL